MTSPDAALRRSRRWKRAFFGMLLFWLFTTGWLLHTGLDEGITLTYMREGYMDCEAHRDFLNAQLAGRVTLEDLRAWRSVSAGTIEGRPPLTLDDVELVFDKNGKYLSSTYGASRTP